MLSATVETPNSFTIKRFVPVGNVEAELKRNPSAKVYREIVMTIGRSDVVIALAYVTKEAASGGYRNGAMGVVNVQVPTETFMTGDVLSLTSGLLAAEPYSVLSKILQVRDKLAADRGAVERVIDLMATV